jgi:type IV pilus assembly protein PilF
MIGRRTWCLGLAVLLACGAGIGCAVTEEKVKKSNGYHQEGLAFMQTDRQRAFVSFQKAVQINPRNRDAHYALGHLYAVQAKYPEAEEEFRKTLDVDPDYAEAHNYLGQMLQQQNRWPDAIQSYRHALNSPFYATPDLALFNLGVALAHEGDNEGASRALEDALRIDPPTVPPAAVHLELGRVYQKMGYATKARDSLSRVAALNKGGPFAAEAERLLERLNP